MASPGFPPTGPTQPVLWREWWRLVRPFSLTASSTPVLVGSAVSAAEGTLRSPDLLLAMLVASALIQAATNMFNEYYDYRRGLDTPKSVGIAGAIVRGTIPAIDVFKVAMACFTVALALGLYIVAHSSPAVFVVGVLSALVGYLYTGGPLPFAYTPLGEMVVFFFMGPVIVALAYYIQAGRLSPSALWASLPVGCLVAAILLANNLRDRVSDQHAGRKTIPVLLGRRVGLALYGGLLLGAVVLTLAGMALHSLPPTVLIAFIPSPTMPGLVRAYQGTQDPAVLNQAVRGSAALHARFGLLLAAGIAIGPLAGWAPPAF